MSDWLDKILKGEKRPTKRMPATRTDAATPIVKDYVVTLIHYAIVGLVTVGLLVWALASMRW